MNIGSEKNETTATIESQIEQGGLDPRLTREEKAAPLLSHRGLTIMLLLMCFVPMVTIIVLWQYLPNVYEGKLKADVVAEGLPTFDFYETVYYERPPFEGGAIIVQNKSDEDWTNINLQVNGNYQIYDNEPIPAGTEKRFLLDKFLNRTGARFSLQYNELNRVRIYARQPEGDRATFVKHFDTLHKVKTNWWPVVILLGSFAIMLFIAARVFSGLYKESLKEKAQQSLS